MGLRDRMQERRDGGGGNPTQQFKMRQKLLSIGDDFWIEDAAGNRVYKVNGKALRVRATLMLEDPSGQELLKIQQKLARIRDTMDIEDSAGNTVVSVKKAMITPLRERWVAKFANGHDFSIQGNILDHEYTMEWDGRKVAEVSKKWFRVADCYGVEIAEGQNVPVVLAIAAVLDMMAQPGN